VELVERYDGQLADAAQQRRYEPATVDGRPATVILTVILPR